MNRGGEGEILPEEVFAAPHITPENPIWRAGARTLPGRMMFTTNAGFLGLGPQVTQKDDAIAVIFGCHVPMVLRPKKIGYETICFEVIGEAYMLSNYPDTAPYSPKLTI